MNVARLLHSLDAPETAGFVAALAPVNALADAAPGFVWRLQTDSGDATAIRVFDAIIVNLSVWESLEAFGPSFTAVSTSASCGRGLCGSSDREAHVPCSGGSSRAPGRRPRTARDA